MDEVEENNSLIAFRELIMSMLLNKKRGEAIEEMVNYITQREKLISIRNDEDSEVWIYHEGIFVPEGKSYIKNYVRDILKNAYTGHLANAVIERIVVDNYMEQEEFFKEPPPDLIVVENGIIDLKLNKLMNFTDKIKFFNKMPVIYDKSKDCPAIKQFFKEVLKDEKDLNIIQEMFGFILYREYFLEKSIMLLGKGGNGKGKTLDLIKQFIGASNCCEVSLNAMENDNFILSELFKKQVNLSGDLSKYALKNTGNFKKLTGRDLITAPRKFKRPITFVNYAKMIFSCNELPMTYDLTDGFWRRWIMLDYPFQFLPEKEYKKEKDNNKYVKLQDPDIIKKIVNKDELSGLLNWSIEGLHKLFKNKEFSYNVTCKELEKEWMRKSNSFSAFCMDLLEEEYDSYITKKELRGYYHKYCNYFKLRSVSDKSIKHILSEKYGVTDDKIIVDGSSVWCWLGIKLKNFQESKVSKDFNGFFTYIQISNSYISKKTVANLANHPDRQKESVITNEEVIKNEIYHKCSICQNYPSHFWDKNGKPICKSCKKGLDKLGGYL